MARETGASVESLSDREGFLNGNLGIVDQALGEELNNVVGGGGQIAFGNVGFEDEILLGRGLGGVCSALNRPDSAVGGERLEGGRRGRPIDAREGREEHQTVGSRRVKRRTSLVTRFRMMMSSG